VHGAVAHWLAGWLAGWLGLETEGMQQGAHPSLRCSRQTFRVTKISNFGTQAVPKEDVSQLEVTMQDVALVAVPHASGQLLDVVSHLPLSQGLPLPKQFHQGLHRHHAAVARESVSLLPRAVRGLRSQATDLVRTNLQDQIVVVFVLKPAVHVKHIGMARPICRKRLMDVQLFLEPLSTRRPVCCY
jgi:hypothetical protein